MKEGADMSDKDTRRIYDKFDRSLLKIVIFAKAASINAKLDCLYPESFAVGILTAGENEVTSYLLGAHVDLEKCLRLLKNDLEAKRVLNESKALPNYDNLKIDKSVLNACKEAEKIRIDLFQANNIMIHHLFLALLRSSKFIKAVFENEGFQVKDFINNVTTNRDAVTTNSIDKNSTGRKTKSLESFCINVTEQARKNNIDPIISREKEIDSAITILCRRNKNNPIFIGEPGVGKTAIVEGIAQRIVSKTVPKPLIDSELYSLNLSSLVAGTKYRGDFEDRMQSLIKEVQNSPKCILFIDEIHTLVGAGNAAGGALDASNILKPFLARNDFKCIGATTFEDYKKYFKKDGALVRRFQQIMVEEPTQDQVKQILTGIKNKYESFHNCIITDDAIDSIIKMSARYLSDRNFPDKAIDIMDMTCAKCVWDKNIDKSVITTYEVAQSISDQCSIPIEVILWDDNERIKRIEETLSRRIIGQNKAIEIVCRVLKNAFSGIRNPEKPIGSFVFGGQTGTGKTYMAKELANAVFGEENSFIKLDMSEFSEPHSVSKLVGSPPGYVGFQEVDIFIDKIKRRPYSIVLLDEFEKAHPDVLKLFLQVMSDGIMTDSQGNKANFKNVVLVMTGNFGMNEREKDLLGFSLDEKKDVFRMEQNRVIKYCQEKFGAEFVNRVDEFIPFMPLSDEELKRIITLNLNEMENRLINRQCKIYFSDEVDDFILQKSKSEYGKNASIIKRIIVKNIEPCISDALLSDKDKTSFTITISVQDNQLVYKKKKNAKRKVKLL